MKAFRHLVPLWTDSAATRRQVGGTEGGTMGQCRPRPPRLGSACPPEGAGMSFLCMIKMAQSASNSLGACHPKKSSGASAMDKKKKQRKKRATAQQVPCQCETAVSQSATARPRHPRPVAPAVTLPKQAVTPLPARARVARRTPPRPPYGKSLLDIQLFWPRDPEKSRIRWP